MATLTTLGEAYTAGWGIRVRCQRGDRRGIVRIDPCQFEAALDMQTLVCTRGRDFPLARIASRLRCPNCGDIGVTVLEYRGYQYIGNDRWPNDPDMRYARTYRTVPIVYDATRPAISSLNFRNRVFAQNPVAEMFRMLGIFGGIWALLIALKLVMAAVQKARKPAV